MKVTNFLANFLMDFQKEVKFSMIFYTEIIDKSETEGYTVGDLQKL